MRKKPLLLLLGILLLLAISAAIYLLFLQPKGTSPTQTTPAEVKFAVTKITTNYSPKTYPPCPSSIPVIITLSAKITANKAGTVHYKWVGSLSAEGTLLGSLPITTHSVTFSKAGTKTVTTTTPEIYEFGGTYVGKFYLKVTSPNSIRSTTTTRTHTFTGCR